MFVVKIILRICAGLLGLALALFTVFELLLFLSNTLQEMESAKQYGGHVSLLGAVGGILMVLIFIGFAGLIFSFLARYAIRGNKSN
jgi:hypothetical protein